MWEKQLLSVGNGCTCGGEGISLSLSLHLGKAGSTSGVSWVVGFWKRTRDEFEQT